MIAGTINYVIPKSFGNSQHLDNELSPSDDISITFNEQINPVDLYSHANYIEVNGIINGTDLISNEYISHDASL